MADARFSTLIPRASELLFLRPATRPGRPVAWCCLKAVATLTSGELDRGASPWVFRAWLSVALIPVFLVGLSYAALTFYRETRYEGASHYVPEWTDGMPWWAVLLQGVIGVAIFSIPCVMAVWCGRRATRDGDHRGGAPQILGILALVGYVLLVLASSVGNLV